VGGNTWSRAHTSIQQLSPIMRSAQLPEIGFVGRAATAGGADQAGFPGSATSPARGNERHWPFLRVFSKGRWCQG